MQEAMQDVNLELIRAPTLPSRTIRDWVAPCFRHSRLMTASFLPDHLSRRCLRYLVDARPISSPGEDRGQARARRPAVNADPNTQLAMTSLTEEDLNSEVELLKSRDLLEKVVVASSLDALVTRSFFSSIRAVVEGHPGAQLSAGQLRTLQAVQSLKKSLSVEPIKKRKLILVTYESSAKVLQTLVRLYLEKHVAVHRVPGAAAQVYALESA